MGGSAPYTVTISNGDEEFVNPHDALVRFKSFASGLTSMNIDVSMYNPNERMRDAARAACIENIRKFLKDDTSSSNLDNMKKQHDLETDETKNADVQDIQYMVQKHDKHRASKADRAQNS